MNNTYKQLARGMKAVIVLAGLLLSGAASAQSGPVGNEWIVPGQQYYRVKILRNGLYKLNYQYLTQAGIAGVAPSQLQIWRRGRELATYKGGSTTVLDPTSFVEFYAIQNDGRLDRELYKRAEDQAHMLYSFYTDTASYFITWSVGAAARPGRAMAQPVTAAGTPHPYRLLNRVQVKANIYLDSPLSRLPDRQTFLPWLEGGEGFFGGGGTNTADSLRNVSPVGPAPRVEVLTPNWSLAIWHLSGMEVVVGCGCLGSPPVRSRPWPSGP